MDEAQAGIKIAGRNINNIKYADDATLMVESEEELMSLLMKVQENSEKLCLLVMFAVTYLVRVLPFLIFRKKIKSDTVSIVSPSIYHEVMVPDTMIFLF